MTEEDDATEDVEETTEDVGEATREYILEGLDNERQSNIEEDD